MSQPPEEPPRGRSPGPPDDALTPDPGDWSEFRAVAHAAIDATTERIGPLPAGAADLMSTSRIGATSTFYRQIELIVWV